MNMLTLLNRCKGTMVSIVLLCLFVTAPLANAADVTAYIKQKGDSSTTIALGAPNGNSNMAGEMQKAILNNLNIVPFLKTLDSRSIPGGGVTTATGAGTNFSSFAMAGAQLVVVTNWATDSQVELRVFDTNSGGTLMGNRYDVSGDDGVNRMADVFSDDLLQSIIGKSTLFRSTLAFVRSGGKFQRDVWAVKANGRNLRQLTKMKGEALSPAWSFDNRFVVFSHLDKRSHGLGVLDVNSKTTQRIKFPGSTVIGPAFFPDNRVAVSMTDGRNPSIFMLSSSFQKMGRIDESSAIEVSPSIDASGSLMAFTSSRQGGPQIFLKDLRSGSVRRISQGGSYNTDPSISPDGTSVVFARMEGGGHRLFVADLVTGQEHQVTFGPGSDEAPEFSSDGYFIAFMSNRNGKRQLFLTTRDGATPRLIPTGTGDAMFPAWNHIKN